jgi:hypothetical protein
MHGNIADAVCATEDVDAVCTNGHLLMHNSVIHAEVQAVCADVQMYVCVFVPYVRMYCVSMF